MPDRPKVTFETKRDMGVCAGGGWLESPPESVCSSDASEPSEGLTAEEDPTSLK